VREAEQPKADFYAAAVYGSIVTAALLGAFRQERASAETALLALLSTMAMFWLVHVWSTVVGERIELGRHFPGRRVLAVARSEWPLVEAAFAPSAVLLLGWAGVFRSRTALSLALGISLLELVAWGLVVGRRAYESWWQAIAAGLVDGALGVGLVALEIAVVRK
jgi:hypothetical protein